MSNVQVQDEGDGSIYATATAQYIMDHLLPEWKDLFLRKHYGYGEMHALDGKEFGMKAQYLDIHRKVRKLRRAFWDGEPIGDEDPKEVLLDLIGHCFLSLDLLARGSDKHGKRT
jgi:hypothetical protein